MRNHFYKIILLLAVCATLGLFGSTWADECPVSYYVSPTGDDSNNCLFPGTPCKTIQRALDVTPCQLFPTVFSPLRADSSVCDPGETPLECELRVHQPAFVLISMEFRYEGRTAEIHEKYLRQAVEYALSRGIIPIVATKADNFEGDHSLNRMTAQIAYDYDLPLWNYWLAVQFLPGHGVDWERDSYGFHVTPDAWLVRSQTFLQTLDSLWKEALEAVEGVN